MEANTSRTNPDTFEELRQLQKQLEEKETKIKDLKAEIESIKLSLKGEKIKEHVGKGKKMENLKILSEKYDRLRAEYNAVLAEKKREKK